MPLIGTTNEEKIWNYLKASGLSDYGIAGLMGNLYAESGLRPNNLQNTYEGKLGMTDAEYTELVDKGLYTNFVRDSAGYGLAQWTYWSRKQALLAHALSTGKSIGDLEMQLEFLLKELASYGLINKLNAAASVLAASNIVLLEFEKPASKDTKATQNKRAEYSQQYFDKFSNAVTEKGGIATMKYTSANPPMKCFMRQSTWYKGAGKTTVRGVLWHSTGANNTTLKRYVQPDDNAQDKAEMLKLLGVNQYKNDWNHITRQAGVHAWIGKLASGEITSVQVGDWDKKAWGCGAGKYGSCNNGWIQFEICEDDLTNPDYFQKVYQEAVELTAYLCKFYNLDPNGTVTFCGIKTPIILCHQDSYQLGLGGNHSDVYHWFKKYGKTMEDVRKDVAALMRASGGTATPVPAPSGATNFQSYKVRITATNLRIRKGPGTDTAIVQEAIEPNVYTIVEEAVGKGATLWGKLKSGIGWVSLDYCKKLS